MISKCIISCFLIISFTDFYVNADNPLPDVTYSDLLKQIVEIKKELKETQNEKNEIFNVVFNNEVSLYQLFTDVNGKNKAFIIPLSAMRKHYTFDESVNLCNNLNSTLIEIQSLEKQIILESFLGRLVFESNQFIFFWINRLRDTSGKWKWIESNTQFNYTNWDKDNPDTVPANNNIFVKADSTNTFGKWYNEPKTVSFNVICEHTFVDFYYSTNT